MVQTIIEINIIGACVGGAIGWYITDISWKILAAVLGSPVTRARLEQRTEHILRVTILFALSGALALDVLAGAVWFLRRMLR